MNVRLFTWDLDADPRSDDALDGLLSPDEQARAARFKFGLHQRRYRVGRAVLRTTLGACLGKRPEALVFSLGDQGKPYLRDGPSFNMAHSEQRLLLAVADEGRLGVDVECARPVGDWAVLAQHYFSADEVEALWALPENERERAFLVIWTRKEALIKAMGGGLSIALNSFSVCADNVRGNVLRRSIPKERSNAWEIHGIEGPVGALAAFALDRRVDRVYWEGQHRVD